MCKGPDKIGAFFYAIHSPFDQPQLIKRNIVVKITRNYDLWCYIWITNSLFIPLTMKKTFLLLALIIALAQLTKAQTNTVTGSVKDEKGAPLHYVFVGDSQYRNATFSDSLGNFTIAVHPDSKLQFQLAGHKDATAGADKASLQVVLESTGGSAAPTTISTSQEVEKPMDLS